MPEQLELCFYSVTVLQRLLSSNISQSKTDRSIMSVDIDARMPTQMISININHHSPTPTANIQCIRRR